jgi:YbgC/YbaW family acyl-CoA thioester hydrolase
MTTEPFRTTRRMEFVDTDMAGIVHFSNFFRFMEAAEVEFLHSRGLYVTNLPNLQEFGFPRVAASCDYLKPARFMDVVEIVVRVVRLGTKSVTYGFEFRRGDDLLAKGSISTVCCLVKGARDQLESIEIPAEVRAKLGPEMPEAS